MKCRDKVLPEDLLDFTVTSKPTIEWLFEHADPGRRTHPQWNSLLFDYGRNEVRSFLGSSAFFWLGAHNIDLATTVHERKLDRRQV